MHKTGVSLAKRCSEMTMPSAPWSAVPSLREHMRLLLFTPSVCQCDICRAVQDAAEKATGTQTQRTCAS